jgi:hypothetical protein
MRCQQKWQTLQIGIGPIVQCELQEGHKGDHFNGDKKGWNSSLPRRRGDKKYNFTIRKGTKVYDKTKRRICRVIRVETHDRFKCKWYVVEYNDGLVRNCFREELRNE